MDLLDDIVFLHIAHFVQTHDVKAGGRADRSADFAGLECEHGVGQHGGQFGTLAPAQLAAVQQKLGNIRKRILGGEDFAGLAQTSSQDVGSAADGGDLGWSTADQFVPDFAKVVNDAKVDEISEPFHTQYGWHIVQVLGRRKYDDTKELQRKEAADQIRASRVDEETELWLRRLRDDAYVDLKS